MHRRRPESEGHGHGAVSLPAEVLAFASRGPEWADFVDGLPARLGALLSEWELTVDGAPTHGFCALVLPVRTAGGRPAALKVGFVDEESEHEALALTHWGGRGAVELLRADPRRGALLLERLQFEDLGDLWDLEACEIVAGLYGRLHRPATPPFRSLARQVARRSQELAELPRDAGLPRRMVEQAVALGRAFADDDATTGTLVHTDLHYANVLAGDREPWLAIDPKPLDGDPHYEVAPMLINRFDELAGDVRGGVRRRFHTLIDAASLDEDRARDWVIFRMMSRAAWLVAGDGVPDSAELLTRCLAVAKAVQD